MCVWYRFSCWHAFNIFSGNILNSVVELKFSFWPESLYYNGLWAVCIMGKFLMRSQVMEKFKTLHFGDSEYDTSNTIPIC